MVASISNSTDPTAAASASSGLAAALGGDQALGKDSFLKLLVAQIANQDPLNPMDNTAFVAQLAQFSALEQQLSTNQLLQLVATQQQGLANNGIVDLVGKTVTVKGSMTTLSDSGAGAPVRFTLGDDANSVTVTIRDLQGQPIRTMKVGAKQAGVVNLAWDGKNDSGTQQPPGVYSISVSATGADGGAIEVLQQTTGVVKSISFEQGYPNLQLDNGVTAPASELLSVNGK